VQSADETSPPPAGARWILAGYCLLIVLASLAGGWLPFWIQLTHTRMQLIISLVAGLMLGVALFHLLPHAFGELAAHGSAAPLDRAVRWVMCGLLTMFFLIRAFHFHQHGVAEVADSPHEHDHDHDHDDGLDPHAAHQLSWVGATFGLALHTLIDGMALGASVEAEALHQHAFWLWGLGTFLAIVLHKPLDAVSISSLMAAGGWSPRWRHLVNAGFALMCPLGAAVFLLGVEQSAQHQHLIVGCGLAFAAGVFLCISLGDLLPELEFHSHDRLKLSAALLLGIVLAWGIGFLEPAHTHQHSTGPNAVWLSE
jgi:zinc and cadmium transporter